MSDEGPSRITDELREATLLRVKGAFVGGHISHSQMDQRLEEVLGAVTDADLVPVLASLPDSASGRTVRLTGKSGRFHRAGAWRVPQVLIIESDYGKVDLDLSQDIIEDPVVTIELQLRFGWARITVPSDVFVDIDDLRTVWKQPTDVGSQRLDTAGRRIRLTGTMEYGRLKVRRKSR